MAITVDAHQHFWQLSQPFNYQWLNAPSLAPIRRDYLPEHLRPLLQQARIDKTIFVQTQHDVAENRWALKLAEQNDFIVGVVGWVDLASRQCEEQLLEFKDHPKFVGVRHVTQDEPDDDFILREDVMHGLRVLEKHNVPFDLLFYEKHLRHAATLARQLPNLRMVIDHLSKPRIKAKKLDDWLPHIHAASEFPNVYCKLSGMITEADWNLWKPGDLKPYVNAVLDSFGPERCMFGSDWPVCELAGAYTEVVVALIDALEVNCLSESEAIFGGTANEFYGLKLE